MLDGGNSLLIGHFLLILSFSCVWLSFVCWLLLTFVCVLLSMKKNMMINWYNCKNEILINILNNCFRVQWSVNVRQSRRDSLNQWWIKFNWMTPAVVLLYFSSNNCMLFNFCCHSVRLLSLINVVEILKLYLNNHFFLL